MIKTTYFQVYTSSSQYDISKIVLRIHFLLGNTQFVETTYNTTETASDTLDRIRDTVFPSLGGIIKRPVVRPEFNTALTYLAELKRNDVAYPIIVGSRVENGCSIRFMWIPRNKVQRSSLDIGVVNPTYTLEITREKDWFYSHG